MLLSMDKNGNIYQAAAHRPDGKGVEKIPVLSGSGDVSLENPYLRAEVARNSDWKLLQVQNAQDDLNAAVKKRQMGNVVELNRKKQARYNNQLLRRDTQASLAEEAVLQGMHGADYNMLDLSGYPLSSDGRRGKSEIVKAREAALLQAMGASAPLAEQGLVFELEAEEKEQYELSVEAQRLKKQMAEEQIALNQGSTSMIQPGATKATLPATYAHPGNVVQAVKAAAQDEARNDQLIKYAVIGGLLFLVMRK